MTFICSICPEAFLSLGGLESHWRLHWARGESPKDFITVHKNLVEEQRK